MLFARPALVSLLIVLASGSLSGAPPAFPLHISRRPPILVDRNEHPFFINGDTAWSILVSISREDAELYLEDRRRKGFNLVLVNLLEHKFSAHPPANYYGQAPFKSPGDFNTPNDAYFAHADWVVRRAEEKGITVLLAPLYLGWTCGDEGWCQEVKASTADTMRRYGRYVGQRYRSFSNIVWLIGGDADPFGDRRPIGIRQWVHDWWSYLIGQPTRPPDDNVAEKVRAFVAGLKESDPVHLLSAHNATEQSASDVWADEAWLDLNNVYTYRHSYAKALREYARRPFKPFFLIETKYENWGEMTPLTLRRQAYWTVLSGGTAGHIFGNCEIWGFSWGFCHGSWKDQLDSPGSRTLALLGHLFTSRAFSLLVPDVLHHTMIGGHQNGPAYAPAARASDASTIIAYLPTPRQVIVNLSELAGTQARAWWFNPRSGKASLIGVYATSSAVPFVPPGPDDWVLVIDNASLDLPPPGSVAH